jgi:PAS domain S-box-containing protein
MVLDAIRTFFKPLFGSDRDDLVKRFLFTIITSVIVVNAAIVGAHLWDGGRLFGRTTGILTGLLAIQFVFLWLLRRGFTSVAAVLFVISGWLGITLQMWNADGIRDSAVYVYMLIILMAALLTGWRVSLTLSALSIIVVWVFAVLEARGIRPANLDAPLHMARDLTAIFLLFMVVAYLLVNALRHALDTLQAEAQDRGHAEHAIHIQEERFHKIFDATPVAVAITTLRDGRLVNANEAYWKLSGLNPDTSLGRTVFDLKIWENEEERRGFFESVLEKKSLRIDNNDFVDLGGVHHLTNVIYELIDLGDEPAILTMHYDMTDKMKAQDELRRSEERFRKVFYTSPVAIVITTLEEGRVIDANESYWRLSGYDPGESRGSTVFELRPSLNVETRQHFTGELKEKKSIYIPAYAFENLRGEILNTVAFFELIEMEDEAAILSMFYDMTEQDKARHALRHSEARLRAMLEAVPDMIFELKRDGTIVQFLPSATEDLFPPPYDFVGKKITDILPEVAEQASFTIERALASGQVNAFEHQFQIGSQERTFEARVTPVGNDLVLAIMRDITLQKWATSEREELIAELEQKNAELERFTYTASHDLKSPLITIRGFLGFVREDARAGDMERLDRDIQRITDATEKMQRLLGDLLELSRVGRINNRPVQIAVNELIAEVVEILQGRILARNIKIKVAENLPALYGDRPRIFEVFQNLIDNAAKFMGDQPEPCIEIGVNGELNGKPIYFVRDNGIGIAPKFKDRIFGLFDKLDATSEGTGIGLALIKRIVEFHGGQIWVDSEPGNGATFFFSLPTPPEPAR